MLTSSSIDSEFYVIKKKVSGEYLLSGKNEVVKKFSDENNCWVCFVDSLLNRKSNSETYVMCSKEKDKKYIHIMCER